MLESANLLRLRACLEDLAPHGLCVAFSGGVDSSLVLKAACDTGARVHAVTASTLFHSPAEAREAAELAGSWGAVFQTLCAELPEAVLENPPNRCYLCKKALFSGIGAYAMEQGLLRILDGTNADDLGEYRPGLQALRELGVYSPLAHLGYTKQEVRAMAEELGLVTAHRPGAPCLATRYPYGHRVDTGRLPGIDRVERKLRELGAANARARVEGDSLRLEVSPIDFSLVLLHREEIIDCVLESGFVAATLDLEGFRSGSMDIRAARLAETGTQPAIP